MTRSSFSNRTLPYVFDVADTGERKNSRPVQLWKMNAEHEQPIIRALDAAFDVPVGAVPEYHGYNTAAPSSYWLVNDSASYFSQSFYYRTSQSFFRLHAPKGEFVIIVAGKPKPGREDRNEEERSEA